jgi:two-component system chemotaxis response regulator CheB
MSLRVLVADDAILFRRVISDALASLPDVEVVGTAANGKLALQKVRELKPDLLTLDLEMPETDGLAVLDALKQSGEKVAVIVVSALTHKGGQLTIKALEKGAFDFITKPDAANMEQSRAAIRQELAVRVRALSSRLAIRHILHGSSGPKPAAADSPSARPAATPAAPQGKLEDIAGRMSRIVAPGRPQLVLIGVSTGGPNALARLLPQLPKDLGVPILIVQHMPPLFTQTLAENLAAKSAIRVREAAHGDVLQPNTAYIAPGGKQMRVTTGPGGSRLLQITDDPPENNCRPAVDYLFRSVASHFPGQAMAVILTGMGNDGTVGLRLLKRQGCFVIAQDEATCVVYGMPKAAFEAGVTDLVLPLDAIAPRIAATVRGGKP